MNKPNWILSNTWLYGRIYSLWPLSSAIGHNVSAN